MKKDDMSNEQTQRGDCAGVDGELDTMHLRAGTQVYLRGLPVRLLAAVVIESNVANIRMLRHELADPSPEGTD